MQPDEIDWKIISILKEGYVPNNTITLELGVSEGTVRARLKNKQLVLVAMRVAESKLLDRKVEGILASESFIMLKNYGKYV